jgi:hypothetical protein
MRPAAEARLCLLGALRLAGFRADGIRAFANNLDAAKRSFRQVMPFMLMGFIALAMLRPTMLSGKTMMMAFAATDAQRGSSLGFWITLHVLAQIIKWAGFLALTREVLRLMGHDKYFPRFIQVFNWMLVVRLMVLLFPLLAVLLGLMSVDGARLTIIGVSWGVMTYQWFGYRTALEVPGSLALALVLIETILTVFVGGITLGMLIPPEPVAQAVSAGGA